MFDRDYRRVAHAARRVGLGAAGHPRRRDGIARCARCASRSSTGRCKDISFGTLLLRLFEISRRFNMEVQPQLILLQKTLLNIEGLGRELYPELDIWNTASPILRDWMRERVELRCRCSRACAQQSPGSDRGRARAAGVASKVPCSARGAARSRCRSTPPEIEALKAELRAQQPAARCHHRSARPSARRVCLAGGRSASRLARMGADRSSAQAGCGRWRLAAASVRATACPRSGHRAPTRAASLSCDRPHGRTRPHC